MTGCKRQPRFFVFQAKTSLEIKTKNDANDSINSQIGHLGRTTVLKIEDKSFQLTEVQHTAQLASEQMQHLEPNCDETVSNLEHLVSRRESFPESKKNVSVLEPFLEKVDEVESLKRGLADPEGDTLGEGESKLEVGLDLGERKVEFDLEKSRAMLERLETNHVESSLCLHADNIEAEKNAKKLSKKKKILNKKIAAIAKKIKLKKSAAKKKSKKEKKKDAVKALKKVKQKAKDVKDQKRKKNNNKEGK
eukprot:CAMPEP_0196575064 /NCGR_PEP_ID=MMETSP1081-20130531/4632_1 /TAXON_ID=36882 /ORGANISM="Pyramimonas amylifera, Strain CCMP720" /LENGTH=248 /DNA_ID=CAMNT_0041893255 /DNA_START=8 /DNA_END=754 /DNA_ORIENTATION=-